MQNKKPLKLKAVWSSNLTVDQHEDQDNQLQKVLNKNDSNKQMSLRRDVSMGAILGKDRSLATFDTNTTPGNQDSVVDHDTL